jgi:hypothetical protein
VIQFNRSNAGPDTYRKLIADCDVHIEHCLARFDARVDLAREPYHALSLPFANAPPASDSTSCTHPQLAVCPILCL